MFQIKTFECRGPHPDHTTYKYTVLYTLLHAGSVEMHVANVASHGNKPNLLQGWFCGERFCSPRSPIKSPFLSHNKPSKHVSRCNLPFNKIPFQNAPYSKNKQTRIKSASSFSKHSFFITHHHTRHYPDCTSNILC